MTITATLWDKTSPVTLSGKLFSADFLRNHWNGESRVLIAYNGDISRVQAVTDTDFNPTEKTYLLDLINSGIPRDEAITRVWEYKAISEMTASTANPSEDG